MLKFGIFPYWRDHWYKSAGPSCNPPNKQVKRPINTENGNLSHIFPMSMLSLKIDSWKNMVNSWFATTWQGGHVGGQ